ncbi:hypothetical protein M569_16370 [Genlisea aurea]|uniref:Sulfite exporter TauE/SafE family protein n=1 Tax=Genlisea aurea TaxID=192259 RepID=S8BVR2_9LAMI|nr:hypothetical protein M569_16370 [Genlisea aurea]
MMRLRSREFLLILIVWTLAGASIGKRLRRDTGEEIKTTSRLAPPPSFLLNKYLGPNVRFILSAVVSFIAAAVSTAGGLGGGGLFLPILTILAGMDLKTASGYSVLMVTGGMICSVGCQLTVDRTKSAIDFEVALLSEPCMLGGVTVGVICNAVFPDWLTFVIFVAVLSFNTFKTCSTAVKLRKRESRDKNERGIEDEITEIPIAGDSESRRSKPLILAAVWLCFFLMESSA